MGDMSRRPEKPSSFSILVLPFCYVYFTIIDCVILIFVTTLLCYFYFLGLLDLDFIGMETFSN